MYSEESSEKSSEEEEGQLDSSEEEGGSSDESAPVAPWLGGLLLMTDVPDDCIATALCYLDTVDLMRVSEVCKALRALLATDSRIWAGALAELDPFGVLGPGGAAVREGFGPGGVDEDGREWPLSGGPWPPHPISPPPHPFPPPSPPWTARHCRG